MEKLKELRDKTGAGIGDCKKALDEAEGNTGKAVEILRKKGIAKAAKRGDREADEGVILVDVNEKGNEGYILEINSETDFVARNDKFQSFAKNVLGIIKLKKPAGRDELMREMMVEGHTVRENLDSLSGIIGEKIDIKRFDILSGGTVAAYSHMGGRIGVLVALDKAEERELARDIAMQIAAANPAYISPADVPAEEIEKEKEIYAGQLKKEGKPAFASATAKAMAGKPEEIINKIMTGKLNKYYEEVCLVKQEYIKDDKKKVENILSDAKVEKFVRYNL